MDLTKNLDPFTLAAVDGVIRAVADDAMEFYRFAERTELARLCAELRLISLGKVAGFFELPIAPDEIQGHLDFLQKEREGHEETNPAPGGADIQH